MDLSEDTLIPARSAAAAAPEDVSLEACDEFSVFQTEPDCSAELLGSFVHLMGRHGRSVNADLMRADRRYAMWQLARARAETDECLQAIATRLFRFFDASRA